MATHADLFQYSVVIRIRESTGIYMYTSHRSTHNYRHPPLWFGGVLEHMAGCGS